MTYSTESVSTQSKNQKRKPNSLKRSRKKYSSRKLSRPSERHRVSLQRHSKGSTRKIPPAEVPLRPCSQEKDWTLEGWFNDEDEVRSRGSSFVRDSWERKPFKSKEALKCSKEETEHESVVVLDCQLKESPTPTPQTGRQTSESQKNVVFRTHIHMSKKSRNLPEGKSIKTLLGVNCPVNGPEKMSKLSVETNVLSSACGKDKRVPNNNCLPLEDEEQVCETAESSTESNILPYSMDPPVSAVHPMCQLQTSTSCDSVLYHKHEQLCTVEIHPDQPQCLHSEGKDSLPTAETIESDLEWTGSNKGKEKVSVECIRDDPETISLSDIDVNLESLTETLRTLDREYSSLEKPSEQGIYRRNSISSLSSFNNSQDVSTATGATTSTNTTVHSRSRSKLSRFSEYSINARRPREKRVRMCIARRPRKILILGDMMSGKTNLVSSYSMDRYQDQYIPTLLRCVQTDANVQGEAINMVVLDISGRDDFAPLRKYAYHKVDAVIMCYPVDSIDSLERIRTYWVPELKQHAPKAPFVVVGTKKDIRDEARDGVESLKRTLQGTENEMEGRIRLEADFARRFVSFDRGKRLSTEIGAQGFYECSSMYRDGTRNLFESVAKIAMQKSRRKRRTSSRHVDNMCTIL